MDNPIRIARISANDDTVLLQEWHVSEGAKVQAGDLLLSLETSKATIDVEAEAEGFLHIITPAGATVAVGETVAIIQSRKPVGANGIASFPAPVPSHASPQPQAVRFSKLALAMMAHHGIDPKDLAQTGLIRKQDIEAYLQIQAHDSQAFSQGEYDSATDPTLAQDVQQHNTVAQHKAVGFFSDARKSAHDRGKGIVWLALNYFFRNYCLGHLARLSPLGINLWVHRLRGVKMGRGVYIDPSATIETAYPENVTIGNDVRITANAIIMTHIKAPHALRAQGIVPQVLQPVVLEDHCFIGVNAVIMPGVTIGRGSVVTSGSVVLTNVPPAVMVTGNPAKIVKRLNPVQDEAAE